MAKMMCAYYGDDPYDHDNRISEWARIVIENTEMEETFLKKYTDQMTELFDRKRICWYHIFLLDMTIEGVTSKTLAFRYAKLRERIVLNEAAKEDMLKAKTKRKSFDQVVEEFQAVPPAFAPQNVVGNGIQYAMFEQPVINAAQWADVAVNVGAAP